ncbi:hypothetical protein COOONC_27642, partial [Cooperia oncophora]
MSCVHFWRSTRIRLGQLRCSKGYEQLRSTYDEAVAPRWLSTVGRQSTTDLVLLPYIRSPLQRTLKTYRRRFPSGNRPNPSCCRLRTCSLLDMPVSTVGTRRL